MKLASRVLVTDKIMNEKIKYFISITLIILILVFLWLNSSINKGKQIILEIKQGWSFHKVAELLSDNEIIRSKKFFIFLTKISGKSKKLKAGTYKISDKQTVIQIIKTLTKGKIANKIFTIPEGYNMFQIAEILEEKRIVSRNEFLKICKNKAILKKFNIKAETAEGFLFPDTYYVPYNISAKTLVEIILKNFFKRVDKLYFARMKEMKYTLEEMVTLASLVEWEAQMDFERPIIAAVFLNRLKKNLNLASCATVLYALGKHKRRLLFKDLKKDSPYNTYLYKGLPPTPICNPGLNSILAVLFPAKVDYLYFVSKRNGRHYFSKTYKEHLKAYKYYILTD